MPPLLTLTGIALLALGVVMAVRVKIVPVAARAAQETP